MKYLAMFVATLALLAGSAGAAEARAPQSTTGKATICHATSSETNPSVEITISKNGLNSYGHHEGDGAPDEFAGCPTGGAQG